MGSKATEDEKEKEKPKTYTRTYSNLGSTKASDDEKEKPKAYTRSYTTLTKTKPVEEKKKEPSPPKRYSSRYGSSKDLSTETKTRLTGSYGTAKKEEKGPPITFNTRYKVSSTTRSRDASPVAQPSKTPQTVVERLTAARASREPSPVTVSKSSSGISAYERISAARSRDPSPVSKTYTDSYRDKSSRDSSPVINRRPSITSITSNYSRSREPSPVSNGANKYPPLSSYRLPGQNGRETSRDPSPSSTLNKSLSKLNDTSSLTPYRRPSREPSPYGAASTLSYSSSTDSKTGMRTPRANLSQTKVPDVSISYMSRNETTTRPSRISYINRHSPQKDKLESPSMIPLRTESPKIIPPVAQQQTVGNDAEDSDSSSSASSSEETDDSSEESIKPPEPKIMIQVTTITRGTSPNPPSVSPRVRRIEFAKTIEKVRQRPLQGPPMTDKATQSDRMDDSTRNSRFGITSRSAYSPYSPSPNKSYSSRTTTGLTSSRYSREATEVPSAESETSESSNPSRTSNKSDKFNFTLEKSEEETSVKAESRSSSMAHSPTPSKFPDLRERVRLSSSKSKTPDPAKLLPPQSPTKSESPKIASPKVSNKDFRKSALNMGPTDRVSRSKSSSSDNASPTVEKTRLQFQQLLNGEAEKKPAVERSPSCDSESSTESIDVESQIEMKAAIPTKEEIISHKVEEAKTFLLKTLGNAAAVNSMKSPSPTTETISECTNSQTFSTNYPTQTISTNLGLDFSSLQKAQSGEKPWWMSDDNETQNDNQDNENTAKEEDAAKLLNGFSDMTLKTPQENNVSSQKWPWLNTNGSNLGEDFQKIERVESGERAWWCKTPENKTITDCQAFAQNAENTRNNLWEQETQADISELQQDESCFDASASQLGDRASPEGLESIVTSCKDANGNNFKKDALQDFNARPRLFISRHTNIDDLLGKSLSITT